LVTPTTAELLLWWFGEDMVLARSLNFHAGQRQAILNAIVAHEVLGQAATTGRLLDLYQACAPDALLTGNR
jgi:type III restriction enzyme